MVQKKKIKKSRSKPKHQKKSTAKKKANKKKHSVKKVISKKSSKKKTNKKTNKRKVLLTSNVDGELVGSVTHYFPHVNAAVIQLTGSALKNGDRIYIKGHTTDLKQVVESMQIDHVSVNTAIKGDEIGLGVRDRVREHDLVYKIK